MQIYIVLCNCKRKPHWPPGNLEVSSGWQLQNQGSGQAYKILFGRYWWTALRQKVCAKILSTSLCSLETPLKAPCYMPYLKPVPQAEVPGQIGPFHRKTFVCVCFSLLSVQCPGQRGERGCPARNSPIFTIQRDPRIQTSPGHQIRWSRGVPWVAATKTRITAPCKSSPLGNTGALDHSRGRAQRSAHPLRSLQRITVNS